MMMKPLYHEGRFSIERVSQQRNEFYERYYYRTNPPPEHEKRAEDKKIPFPAEIGAQENLYLYPLDPFHAEEVDDDDDALADYEWEVIEDPEMPFTEFGERTFDFLAAARNRINLQISFENNCTMIDAWYTVENAVRGLYNSRNFEAAKILQLLLEEHFAWDFWRVEREEVARNDWLRHELSKFQERLASYALQEGKKARANQLINEIVQSIRGRPTEDLLESLALEFERMDSNFEIEMYLYGQILDLQGRFVSKFQSYSAKRASFRRSQEYLSEATDMFFEALDGSTGHPTDLGTVDGRRYIEVVENIRRTSALVRNVDKHFLLRESERVLTFWCSRFIRDTGLTSYPVLLCLGFRYYMELHATFQFGNYDDDVQGNNSLARLLDSEGFHLVRWQHFDYQYRHCFQHIWVHKSGYMVRIKEATREITLGLCRESPMVWKRHYPVSLQHDGISFVMDRRDNEMLKVQLRDIYAGSFIPAFHQPRICPTWADGVAPCSRKNYMDFAHVKRKRPRNWDPAAVFRRYGKFRVEGHGGDRIATADEQHTALIELLNEIEDE